MDTLKNEIPRRITKCWDRLEIPTQDIPGWTVNSRERRNNQDKDQWHPIAKKKITVDLEQEWDAGVSEKAEEKKWEI